MGRLDQKHPRYPSDARAVVRFPHGEERVLSLINISKGGMFACANEHELFAPGIDVDVRVHLPSTLLLTGRATVVHVLSIALAKQKHHAPGVGFSFAALDDTSRSSLQRYLAEQARARRGPRIETGRVIVEIASRAELHALWSGELKSGGLFVSVPNPPMRGTALPVEFRTPDGRLSVTGEVVHVVSSDDAKQTGYPVGIGLALNITADVRARVNAYLSGQTQEFGHDGADVLSLVPVSSVIQAARRLFDGLERGDAFFAAGLHADASADDEKRAIHTLTGLFTLPFPDASPAQQARIDTALRALDRVSSLLSETRRARDEGQITTTKTDEPGLSAREVEDVLQASFAAEREGDAAAAIRVVREALQLSKNDRGLLARFQTLDERANAHFARDALERAATMAQAGMPEQSRALVEKAIARLPRDDVKRAGLLVLGRLRADRDAVVLAEELVARHPDDVVIWRVMFAATQRMGLDRDALRAGETLLRLEPKNADVKKRVAELKKRVRW
jgi:tetratricopeptide (TPR) repeat protein